jgi:hypothetical protein
VTRALLAALAFAVLALPVAASPAAALETGMADDRVLLEHPAHADAVVRQWQAIGVDVVRIHARWVAIAPSPGATMPPAGFHAADPNDPHYAWGPLDHAVALVRAAGMRVMLAVTGSGPLWGSEVPRQGNPRLRPDPARFAAFAGAVARRYAPAVDRYLIWNEPNQPGWLQPQFRCRAGRCTPASPILYRALVRAAYPAIRAADPAAQILVGTLAPRGKPGTKRNVAMRPLEFLRAFGCVDRALRPVRTGACRGFTAIPADGFSYHPHGVLRGPSQPSPDPQDASIADLRRLERTLDGLTRAGAFRRRLDLYLTEFGYQTNPPDPISGVAPATQARWLAESAYVAARDPRVRNLTQYEWRDEPVDLAAGAGRYAKWQSGLEFADGRAKPALAAFPIPVWLDAGRRRLWGMVRPGNAADVTVQRRVAGARRFTAVAVLRTAADGTFLWPLPDGRRAAYRVVAPVSPALVLTSAVRRYPG